MEKVIIKERSAIFENKNKERGTWKTMAKDREALKRRAENIIEESVSQESKRY